MLSRVSIDIFSFLLTAFIVKSPKSSSNTPNNTSSRVSRVLARGEVTPINSVQTPVTGVKNGFKQSKTKIWKVKWSKTHFKLEKSQGSSKSKVIWIPNLIKALYIAHLIGQVQSRVKGLFEWRSSGQGPKYKVKFFDCRRGC